MKIIEIIFGQEFANKLSLKIGDTKRNPLTQLCISFWQSYQEKFHKATEGIKLLYIIWPLLTLFVFSGIIQFIVIVFLEYRFIKHIAK